MLNSADKLRAHFLSGDLVEFTYRRQRTTGTILRTNPTRALVRVGLEEFSVPYELLLPDPGIAARRKERIESIQSLARLLLNQHGLKWWRFRFDHSTRCAGSCNYSDRRITLSFELARIAPDAEILDTLLHEIAHALVGKKHNHDAVWKAKAIEIGCSGERTHQLEFSPPRWYVACENRCWEQTADRCNRHLICRACGGQLIYTPYSTFAQPVTPNNGAKNNPKNKPPYFPPKFLCVF